MKGKWWKDLHPSSVIQCHGILYMCLLVKLAAKVVVILPLERYLCCFSSAQGYVELLLHIHHAVSVCCEGPILLPANQKDFRNVAAIPESL